MIKTAKYLKANKPTLLELRKLAPKLLASTAGKNTRFVAERFMWQNFTNQSSETYRDTMVEHLKDLGVLKKAIKELEANKEFEYSKILKKL